MGSKKSESTIFNDEFVKKDAYWAVGRKGAVAQSVEHATFRYEAWNPTSTLAAASYRLGRCQYNETG